MKIKTRKSLKRYSLSLLNRAESIVSTSAFMSYSLWAVGPSINGSTKESMIITIPFVLLGIFRYQLITDPKERGRRNFIIQMLILKSQKKFYSTIKEYYYQY